MYDNMRARTVPWKPAELNDELPLYLAIAEALAADVGAGRLSAGQRLPSQRRLASLIGVDLGTVTRALAECQRRGLVEGTVGRGTFVTADTGAPAVQASVESAASGSLVEMGLVLPLYAQERSGIEALRRALSSLDLARYLRYTDPAGMGEHREAGADWVGRAGVRARPESILVTSGSQNAIACCLLAHFAPGDALAVDELTFPGLKTLARMQNVRLVPVGMDGEGMLPDALERACRREHPRGLYLMPDFQNPTTASLPAGRRREIAEIIGRHALLLIEDDAYGHTIGRHRALSALVPERGIYIGGTSKVFGAGLRISFVACPAPLVARMEGAILSTVWMASPLNAALAARLVADGTVDRVIAAKREEAAARTALARHALAPHPLRARTSGFFAWLELPRGWTGRELEAAAREAGVRVLAAERFAVGGRVAPAAVRVSLTGPETRRELSRGLGILSEVLARDPTSAPIL
jgi:DNA-binding transcriptional MocR family regulator